jgi:hypothetical protein
MVFAAHTKEEPSPTPSPPYPPPAPLQMQVPGSPAGSWMKKTIGRLSRKSSYAQSPASPSMSVLPQPVTFDSSVDLFAPTRLYSASPGSSTSQLHSPGTPTLEASAGEGYFTMGAGANASTGGDSPDEFGGRGARSGVSSPGGTPGKVHGGFGKENARSLSTRSFGKLVQKVPERGRARGDGTPGRIVTEFYGNGKDAAALGNGLPHSSSPTHHSFRITSQPGPTPRSPTVSSTTRFLRRVASAPNAKALFNGSMFSSSSSSSSASSTRNGFLSPAGPIPPLPVGIIPVGDVNDSGASLQSPSTSTSKTPKSSSTSEATASSNRSSGATRSNASPARSRSVPSIPPSPSIPAELLPTLSASKLQLPPTLPVTISSDPPRAAFRRTYSSSSIRVRSVEIGPNSFHKVKLLGKGDVGKVYLVREKKTDKLFAMKVLSKKEMIKRNKIKRALAEQVRPNLLFNPSSDHY